MMHIFCWWQGPVFKILLEALKVIINIYLLGKIKIQWPAFKRWSQSQAWWCTLLIPTLRRQNQVHLCPSEFQAQHGELSQKTKQKICEMESKSWNQRDISMDKVKCLLCKQDDLGLDIQNLCKWGGTDVHLWPQQTGRSQVLTDWPTSMGCLCYCPPHF